MIKVIFRSVRIFLAHQFNLHEDTAEETAIVDNIRRNIDFKGANLWALVFAIFIASIGLNVNSTAVIIGAMLISPIMGPIMGVGLGIGINNLEMVKRGARNLLIATIIGIITSTIYFTITPLHEAQSELLARTSPSIWDVFIAFFGGLAGMVATASKDKTNVLPGVAIATALMPPLCTAGYGIASGNILYFLGAIYLYFINSVFIAIATYLMARYMKMHKQHFEDPANEKRVKRYIIIIVIVTIIPSIFMAARIVNKSIFETNARRFVEQQFQFKNTQVVSKNFIYDGDHHTIDVLLLGDELSQPAIDTLSSKLKNYQLGGTKLLIRQGLNARRQIDLAQIKASILEDVFSKERPKDTVKAKVVQPATPPAMRDTAVLAELKILYPAVRSFGVSSMLIHTIDSLHTDTVKVALARFSKPLKRTEELRLQRWLQARYNAPSLRLVTQ